MNYKILKQALISLIILAGCGRNSASEPVETPSKLATEQDIHEYIDQFMVDAKKYGFNLNKSLIVSVKFEDVIRDNPLIVGSCSGNARAQVLQFKKGESKLDTKITVYHELGHCMLGIGHTDHDTDIMYAYTTRKPLSNWDSAVEDLFEQADRNYTKWTTK